MKRYKSKVSLSIMIPLSIILAGIEMVMLKKSGVCSGAILIGISMLFIAYLYLDTYYTITADGKLIIKGGFLIKREMDINSIKKIKATNNPFSAPAFSWTGLKFRTINMTPF